MEKFADVFKPVVEAFTTACKEANDLVQAEVAKHVEFKTNDDGGFTFTVKSPKVDEPTK